MKVSYAPRARDDLVEIYTWLVDRSPSAAQAALAAIEATIALIGEYPRIGRETDIVGVALLSVVRYPYLVYYQLIENEVVIVHIRHASRAVITSADL